MTSQILGMWQKIRINTPPKINIDTKNDGLEHVSPASNMASFWVSMLNFTGGKMPHISSPIAKNAPGDLQAARSTQLCRIPT